jgi:hypothetical protein
MLQAERYSARADGRCLLHSCEIARMGVDKYKSTVRELGAPVQLPEKEAVSVGVSASVSDGV